MIQIYRDDQMQGFLTRFESRRTQVADDVERNVADILRAVRERGDAALLEFAGKFDGVDLSRIGLQVPEKELERAHKKLDPSLLEVLRESRGNIAAFHQKSLPQSWMTWENDGVVLGQRLLPLEKVGVYVPGGRAAYPSSLLMGVVPAQVAGVKDISIVTPSSATGEVNLTILAAAFELNIARVFRIGGAHAIAALAYGTESVPRVDKIVGPGNIYVASAKKLLFGQCGIDMVAGPSEVVIIADEQAEPGYVAADLLAQAEHDPLASSICITHVPALAAAVQKTVAEQMATLQRNAIIESSLADYGGILLSKSLAESIAISNRLAPEHLGLHVQDSWSVMAHITNAGAIFLGAFSPETVGDYWAGPNHILPTNGSARFFSPLRSEDFLKSSSVIAYTQAAMQKDGPKIIAFAMAEGLSAHANAITRRIRT